jgi:hypothetical protein
MICRRKHRLILAGGILVLNLRRKGGLVRLARGGFFRRRRTRSHSARATVERDV